MTDKTHEPTEEEILNFIGQTLNKHGKNLIVLGRKEAEKAPSMQDELSTETYDVLTNRAQLHNEQ